MAEREANVYMAKLAEQAERYEGKRIVIDAISRHFVDRQPRVDGLLINLVVRRQTHLLTIISTVKIHQNGNSNSYLHLKRTPTFNLHTEVCFAVSNSMIP